jgi:hypothetical protein
MPELVSVISTDDVTFDPSSQAPIRFFTLLSYNHLVATGRNFFQDAATFTR